MQDSNQLKEPEAAGLELSTWTTTQDRVQDATPADIDLSAFHTPQRRKISPYVTTIITIMFVAILAAGYGIAKTINERNTKNSWQDYVPEGTSKSISNRYNIVGAKNNNGTVQLLLEQTSDDKEITAKVTVVFYNSQNTALEAQSGNGTMHGKGTNCIIEIKPNVSFDHMNIINEE